MHAKESKSMDRELTISRLLNAPISLVWEVWTNPDHIKNWWGPHGFTNTIHNMDVNPYGIWNLTMHGPDGKDYRNESRYLEVINHKKIVYEHITGPHFIATIQFEAKGNKTHIQWHMLFDSAEQFIQVVKVFKADEGLKQNMEKLNAYLSAQSKIRKQLKTNNMSRVSTYLNFPGNTEKAFAFYKTVFKSEFPAGGLQRFGDIAPPEGMPPLSEEDKNLILHIELEILGGHVLMATDAPESMGLSVT